MEFVHTFWICFLLIIVTAHSSEACDGYTAEMVRLENCGGSNPVVYIEPNATVWLTENCELVVNGCGWTTGYSSAMVKFLILRNGNRFWKGQFNACDILVYHQESIANFAIDGIKPFCPFEQNQRCIQQTYNVEKYKGLVKIAVGQFDIKVEATHNTGTSCLRAIFDVTYKRPSERDAIVYHH